MLGNKLIICACTLLNAWNRLERLRTSSLTPDISVHTLHTLLMVAFPVPGNDRDNIIDLLNKTFPLIDQLSYSHNFSFDSEVI